MSAHPSRRTLLSAVGFAGAAALSGCSTGNGERTSKTSTPGAPASGARALSSGAPADAAASERSGGGWRYTHLADKWGSSYEALAATSRDDVWLLGVSGTQAGKGKSPARFLEHWDGDRWRAHSLPDERWPAGGFSALAANAPDDVWLAHTAHDDGLSAHHWDGKNWRTLPAPPKASEQPPPQGEKPGPWCVTAGTHLWLCAGERVLHWDGKSWDASELSFQVAAIVAYEQAGEPRAWAVGSVDTDLGEESYPQPASARWQDGKWQKVGTPSYRFPDPVPPEASATLDTVVHDPAHDRLWALGRHEFNHGEVDDEPDAEDILLTSDGNGWAKRRAPEWSRAFDTATTVPDGAGGLLLGTEIRLSPEGKRQRLHAPKRLAEPSEVPSPERKYDFGQPMEAVTARLIPGTRTVLAAGSVRFPNSGTKDTPTRPALVRYDAEG